MSDAEATTLFNTLKSGEEKYHIEGFDPGELVLAMEYVDSNGKIMCQDRIRLTVLKLELVTPKGDPVASPDDSGDGQNEYTYSVATPAVLTINFKAKALGGVDLARIKDLASFTIENVLTNATWAAANPDGKASISGGFLVAKATFTGLPVATNSLAAFGLKNVELKCAELVTEKTKIEVFFPRDAKNNPGTGDPNWFYYWSQIADTPNLVYAGASGGNTLAEVKGIGKWSYTNAPNKTGMFIYDETVTKTKPYGVGEELSGIDLFVGTAIHENQHVTQIKNADPLLPTSGTDSFRYGWSWNKGADHNHWSKGPDGAWGIKTVDDDANSTVDDAATVPPFEPGNGDDVNLDHPMWPQWPNAWALPVPNNAFHPIESQCVNATDTAMNEHDNASVDWADPGKNHQTLLEYTD